MKVIKNNFYFVTFQVTGTSWEEDKYVKADSILDVVNIIEEYTKDRFKNQKVNIIKINKVGQLLESSTKTITVEV